MARFVEFSKAGSGMPVWINADRIDGIQSDATDTKLTMISCSGPDNVWWVTETVAEVLATLQGDPQPEAAKAGDDIAGWWICPTGEACWVIGQTKHDTFAYQYAGRRHVYLTEMEHLQNWTRDPNRKGWEG